RIAASAAVVTDIAASDQAVYGVNTGFGKLAKIRIPRDQLVQLQRNLVLSHAAGVGAPFADGVVRLIIALKVASFAQGFSGVRVATAEILVNLFNARVLPQIPSKRSVGVSGDLAPLAHLAACLLGVGNASIDGPVCTATALEQAGLAPLTLGPKEGLALINGAQVSNALSLAGLFAAENIYSAAVMAGTMSVDATMGSDTPFDARLHEIRGQRAQVELALTYRSLLAGSVIRESHRINDERVQDPYSLRCQPQVMGACLAQMRYAAGIFGDEANGTSDNPIVFADTREILSGENFHAEPLALAADAPAIAIAEIGAMSERRIVLLIDTTISGLPVFLVKENGLNSGFMIAQVTAAALASENKALAHPASVDSIPTSANQEDFVSMATHAARRLTDMADNVATVVGIELLAAAQGIEFRAPLVSSLPIREIVDELRTKVAHYEADRYFSPDIEAVRSWVHSGRFNRAVSALLPSYSGSS
ncbi:MAG: histidine ammonia-lyase, partial [Betaproteobacteria bacterium]|nr:histidine ammonia-lyase [Betaproteobacteria bacterium]